MSSVTKFSIFVFRFDLVSECLYYAHFTECPQHDNVMSTIILSTSVLFTKYHSGVEDKKSEMGRTCGTYGGEGGCMQGFGGEN